MSKWIEENNCHILEGHGNKFVVCHVLYSKQLPPKWVIKQSPFLLDVNNRFETLDKAKTYCEDRYKELNGQHDEITRLLTEVAALKGRQEATVKLLMQAREENMLLQKQIKQMKKEDGILYKSDYPMI